MKSQRHIPESGTAVPDDALLDAARDSILAVGWRRSTLTDVARRAGVSRMTLYRRWDSMAAIFGDLMTREWTAMLATLAEGDGAAGDTVDVIADRVVGVVRALRDDPLFGRILDVDPELLLPYLLDRRGRSQDLVLDLLVDTIRKGQAGGAVRLGDAQLMGRSILLAAHGFAISAQTMTEGGSRGLTRASFDAELRVLVAGYLSP